MKTILKLALAGTLGGAALAAGVVGYRLYRAPAGPVGPVAEAHIDLRRPDALIATQSLSKLPRDVLTVPLLKELLTEDFVFYYEQNEGRLGLQGTLRRIAYEHELSFGDEVLAYVLDTPARLALWKGRDGKLAHYLFIVGRSGLVKALEAVAKVALNDSQLKRRGEVALPGGATLPVYELRYAYRRSLYFAGARDHLLVFSDAGMLLPTAPEDQARGQELLAAADPGAMLEPRFDLGELPARHAVAVSAQYLSFGYQRFFPAIDALRFDFAPAGWSTAVRLTDAIPPADAVWSAVPTGAALCTALPLDAGAVARVLRAAMKDEDVPVQALQPLAVLCWYGRSQLYTPLVLIKTGRQAPASALVKAVFERSVGSHEAGIVRAVAGQPAPESAAAAQDTDPAQEGDPAQDDEAAQGVEPAADEPPASPEAAHADAETPAQPVVTTTYLPPFPVFERPCKGGHIWRREVSSPYGSYEAKASPHAEQMRSARFFAVTLAYCDGTLIFSPDDTLVDQAVAVLDKRYPALADGLPAGADAGAVVLPELLSDLVRDAVLESLPATDEPVFRASIWQRLLPRLDALKGFPAYALEWPAGGKKGWVPIRWQEIGRPPDGHPE